MMATMKEFLITAVDGEARTASEAAERVKTRAGFERELGNARRDAGQLRPSAQGKRVTKKDGRLVVTDGPFDATLDSYYVVRAESLDEAARLATSCPGDAVEVRPVMGSHLHEGKLDESGKVFACAVLGSAPNEKAWIAGMDRIDAATSKFFPPSFRGGMRLEAPTTGKQIKKGHVTDGPFLEAKEVIGGIVFMRMANIDEVVEWAKTSGFVNDGTLEIRELWRT
jgi:hypothetical protein